MKRSPTLPAATSKRARHALPTFSDCTTHPDCRLASWPSGRVQHVTVTKITAEVLERVRQQRLAAQERES